MIKKTAIATILSVLSFSFYGCSNQEAVSYRIRPTTTTVHSENLDNSTGFAFSMPPKMEEENKKMQEEFLASREKWKKQHPTNKSAINAAVILIKNSLKDPDSAKFKDVKIGENNGVVGLVNAKNSFGGYNGFKPFIVYSSEEYAILE